MRTAYVPAPCFFRQGHAYSIIPKTSKQSEETQGLNVLKPKPS